MPWTNPLPPDTRVPGSGNPPADMDGVIDALTAMGAGLNVQNPALAGGADPTGVADSTAAWQAALTAGGLIVVPPGTYTISSTVTGTVAPTRIVCPGGRWATQVNFTGTGDCIRMYNPAGFGTGVGGGILGLTINGTSAGNGSTGLHIGDGSNYELDVVAQNFAGTGSIGVHFDNTVWWTEKIHGTIYVSNNTQNVVFDVSGAITSTNSFGYSDLNVWVNASANQDGVVFQNGALYYHGSLTIRGNFVGSSSAQSSYVLRLTGTIPAGHQAAGTASRIYRCRLDITVETTSGTHTPGTIFIGTAASNAVLGCYGVMDFALGAGTFAATNAPASTNQSTFWYMGIVNGDNNLNPGAIPLPMSIGAHLYSAALIDSSGNLYVASGDFFKVTLSANITVNFNASTNPAVAQRKTITIKQAASGGPYTVTWPASGSPTNSSPTVNWAGGSVPAMSTAANAVDVYKLETYDGATWYGQAIQSAAASGGPTPNPNSGQYLCAPTQYAPATQVQISTFSTTMASLNAAATTVAAGSNGGTISGIAAWATPSAGVLAVANTAGWPTAGTINVAASGATTAVVTYTGVTANTLTGCAYASGSPAGTVSTGGAVTLTGAGTGAVAVPAISTGSFTAPASGSVMVTVNLVANIASSAHYAFCLAAHGTLSPMITYASIWAENTTTEVRIYTMKFLVGSLTPGTSYDFDLMFASPSSVQVIVFAGGVISTTAGSNTLTPVTMEVQAV